MNLEGPALIEHVGLDVHRRAHLEAHAHSEAHHVPGQVRIELREVVLELADVSEAHRVVVELHLTERSVQAKTQRRGSELLAPHDVELLAGVEVGITRERRRAGSRIARGIALAQLTTRAALCLRRGRRVRGRLLRRHGDGSIAERLRLRRPTD